MSRKMDSGTCKSGFGGNILDRGGEMDVDGCKQMCAAEGVDDVGWSVGRDGEMAGDAVGEGTRRLVWGVEAVDEARRCCPC